MKQKTGTRDKSTKTRILPPNAKITSNQSTYRIFPFGMSTYFFLMLTHFILLLKVFSNFVLSPFPYLFFYILPYC